MRNLGPYIVESLLMKELEAKNILFEVLRQLCFDIDHLNLSICYFFLTAPVGGSNPVLALVHQH